MWGLGAWIGLRSAGGRSLRFGWRGELLRLGPVGVSHSQEMGWDFEDFLGSRESGDRDG